MKLWALILGAAILFSVFGEWGPNKNAEPAPTQEVIEAKESLTTEPKKSPTTVDATKIVASCTMLAAETYAVPPAILAGIVKLENGQNGGIYQEGKRTVLGITKINENSIKIYAQKWNVSADTARQWILDDPCTNLGVSAYILRSEVNKTGRLSEALTGYYARKRDITSKEAQAYKEATITKIKEMGLLRETASGDIALIGNGLTSELTVLVNNKIELDFVLDSGASLVSIPSDVFLTLVRTKTITPNDILPAAKFQMADGSIKEQQRFLIRSLQVGNHIIENVEATVTDMDAPLLLGQSFLRKFSGFTVNNTSSTITFHEEAN